MTYKLVQLPRGDDELVPLQVALVPESEIKSHTYNPERVNTRRNQAVNRDPYANQLQEEWYEDEMTEEWEEEEEEVVAPPAPSNQDEEDDEPLFEGAEQGGVTDDFIRQLVLGTGSPEFNEEDDAWWDEEDENDIPMSGEIWGLLTEEERAGVIAAKERGVNRRRNNIATTYADPVAGFITKQGNTVSYPSHPTHGRAIDRQFAEMMEDFQTDEHINDVNSTDFRVQGPLTVEQYLPALQEFVAERAGIDLESAELAKNKGLMQQLRLLEHRQGAFDVNPREGGIYFPAIPSQKQERFAESFMEETEKIRAAALYRMRQRAKEAASSTGDQMIERSGPEEDEKDEEEYTVVALPCREKGERMDCETIVSTYSTYYNQPNIIRPPPSKKSHPSTKAALMNAKKASASTTQKREETPTAIAPLSKEKKVDELVGEHISASLSEGEKNQRKQHKKEVKAAQRQRRQEKSALKQAYKGVEKEEEKKAILASRSSRIMHFS